MEEETFRRQVGPFYTNFVGPAPNFAYHLYDRLISAGNVDGTEFTQEQKDQILSAFPREKIVDLPSSKTYFIPRSHGLIEITTTDPKCTLLTDSTKSVVLGAGVFTFISSLCTYTSLQLGHNGPFHVKFYDIEEKYHDILFTIVTSGCGYGLNFYLSDSELWVYSMGVFSRSFSPFYSILEGTYKRKYKSRDTTSGYIYSKTIGILQKHPKLLEMEQKWELNWDRDLIRASFPPCIALSVKGKYLKEMESLAREICPDATFNGFDVYDREEIPQPEEEIAKQKRDDLEQKEKALADLLATGFIYTK